MIHRLHLTKCFKKCHFILFITTCKSASQHINTDRQRPSLPFNVRLVIKVVGYETLEELLLMNPFKSITIRLNFGHSLCTCHRFKTKHSLFLIFYVRPCARVYHLQLTLLILTTFKHFSQCSNRQTQHHHIVCVDGVINVKVINATTFFLLLCHVIIVKIRSRDVKSLIYFSNR